MITSELRVNLKKSPLYCRFTVAIYLLTGLALYSSAMPLFMKFGFAFFCLWQLYGLLQAKRPHPDIQTLNYSNEIWRLTTYKNNEDYEHLTSLMNMGFCQLYALKNKEGRKRKLIIFQDQLSKNEQRDLEILMMTQST